MKKKDFIGELLPMTKQQMKNIVGAVESTCINGVTAPCGDEHQDFGSVEETSITSCRDWLTSSRDADCAFAYGGGITSDGCMCI